LTKGKDGVEFYIQGKRYLIATQPIKTKNTLGAGDTFLANFTYFHMTGYSIQMAIKKSLQETKKFLQNKY
jgi:sugar/nucleoside kinase (ribokinase family)